MSDSSDNEGEWIGTRRATMATNVLLRKAHTGKQRKAVIPLPGTSHRFGRPPKAATETVGTCLTWQSEPPPVGVQATRGISLPSDSNAKFTYGKAGAAHEDIASVLAQTEKRKQIAAARNKENKIREVRSKERAIAKLPGKTTRTTQTQRAVARSAAPAEPFKMKKFKSVGPKVETRRVPASTDAAAMAASGPIAL